MLTMLALPVVSLLLIPAYSLRLPFRRQTGPTSTPSSTSVVINTTNINETSASFRNAFDNRYTATIEVNGVSFTVLVDTGSSDLWLDTSNVNLTGLTNTNISSSITYVDTTSAEGFVMLANVTLGEFTVVNQAFINAPGSNASLPGIFNGLIGVGPPDGSNIQAELRTSQFNGNHFLGNVFGLIPEEQSFMTFLLTRSAAGITNGGIFTIGEVDPAYATVLFSPGLPVVSTIQWMTFMDGVKIDGQFINGHAIGNYALTTPRPQNSTVVLLDTGTSLGVAPPPYVDAMYKNAPGALFNGVDGYFVPCETKLNISMVFAGEEYPIAPIDAIHVVPSPNDDGTANCSGAFTYTPSDAGQDFILGDSFLRNVYSLFAFNSLTDTSEAGPYMQLLSITDPDEAFAEFDALLQQFENPDLATLTSVDVPRPTATATAVASASASESPTPTATDPGSASLLSSPASAGATNTPTTIGAIVVLGSSMIPISQAL